MDHQRLGVADIGEMREELQPFDEASACLASALDVEAEDRAGALGQQLLGQRMVGMIGQLGRSDALDGRVGLEEIDHLARILSMPCDTQWEGLEALQKIERVQ